MKGKVVVEGGMKTGERRQGQGRADGVLGREGGTRAWHEMGGVNETCTYRMDFANLEELLLRLRNRTHM